MEVDEADSPDRMVYIQNKSAYPVRIAVGQHYPSSIALDPGQTMDFPVDKVEAITASSYGKYAHYLGVVAELNFKGFLQEEDVSGKDFVVNITYEEASPKGIWKKLAKYLFTQKQWALSLAPVDSGKTAIMIPSDVSINKLCEKIGGTSQTVPVQIAKDAALIWSMFPRAADKIAGKYQVYPFHILGIDIGGFIASDEQLRNWADLLYTSLSKRFADVEDKAIWNVVNMLIADATESLRAGKYYAHHDPNYLITLLHRSEIVHEQEDSLSTELISQLEQTVKDPESLALLAQLKTAALKKKPAEPPAPPPAPPLKNVEPATNYKEKTVTLFLSELQKKRPEEETLLDKVAVRVLGLIDHLQIDPQLYVNLKYAALDKLKLIEPQRNSIRQLSQINQYMTLAMMSMIQVEDNPLHAMQNWIGRLGAATRAKAHEYAQLELSALQNRVKEEDTHRDYEKSLMLHLQQNIAKFREPDDS